MNLVRSNRWQLLVKSQIQTFCALNHYMALLLTNEWLGL